MQDISSTHVHFSINVSVAIWLVSTELLYYTAEEVSNEMTNNAREFSKILSDYMLLSFTIQARKKTKMCCLVE